MPIEHLVETIDRILKETGGKLEDDISKYVTVADDLIKSAESHNEYLYLQKKDIQREGRFNFRDLITPVRKINKLKVLRRRLKYMRTRARSL